MLSTKERARAVGEQIVKARKRAGLSQVDLAKKLAERYGKDAETIRRSLVNNETGKYAPRLHMLEAIAEATGQSLDFFSVEGENGSPFPGVEG